VKQVLDSINQIAAVGSTKAKSAIIKQHLPGNELFQKVVKYALDQNKSFNVTELVTGKPITQVYVGEIFKKLDDLDSKRGATDKDIQELSNLAASFDGGYEIVTKIIQKDLKCGCGAKAFNDVMPGLVFEVPYQRFSSFKAIDKIDFESDTVIAQIKYDGTFAYLMPDGSFLSRNGSSYSLNGAIERSEEWISGLGDYLIWMGELLVLGPDGKFLPRKTGNGIINKFISGEGDGANRDKVRYITWGCITVEDFNRGYSSTTYLEMLDTILPFHQHIKGSKIQFSKSEFVKTKEEALAFYKRCRERKEEGAMVKVINKLKWKDESSGSKFGVKLKPVAEAEFVIVDAYHGDKKGKYASALGGLVVKTQDDRILTKIGGGFSDEERFLGVDWWKSQVGRIITAEFTGITTDKSSRETFCLEHSRFSELRHDKTEADSYNYCLEAVNNA